MKSSSDTKPIWLVDPYAGELRTTFYSKTPRDAALKAATRGESRICLVEPDSGKLHIFRGDRVALSDHARSAFTDQRNIVSKPKVSKIAYRNTRTSFERADLDAILEQVRDMLV